jgi:hypothetical protein
MRRRAAFVVASFMLLESCGARTDPWNIPGLSGATPTASGGTGNGGNAGGGGIAGATIGSGTGTNGVGGTGTGGSGAGGVGTGAGGTGAGTGTGGTGAGGAGVGGAGVGGTGTGGGAGTGGTGTGGTGAGGTGTGGTGAGGMGTGGMGTGGAGGGSRDGGMACFKPLPTAATSLDLYFLLDRSTPMGWVDPPDVAPDTRWARITRALETFSRQSGQIRMGLGMFPRNLSCSAATYATADVSIHWANREALIINALARQSPGDETWTRPALEGALSYAFYWTVNTHPADDPASLLPPSVVLMTSAPPTGCGGTIGDLAAAAAASFRPSLRIRTHVVAIGPDAQGLDPVAVAGGTHRAHTLRDFDEVLARIARARTICDMPFDAPFDRPDISRLEVRARLSSSEPFAAIPKQADAESCGAAGGWFLEPPTAPTMIMLCPSTCAAIVDAPAGQVLAGQVSNEMPCDPLGASDRRN